MVSYYNIKHGTWLLKRGDAAIFIGKTSDGLRLFVDTSEYQEEFEKVKLYREAINEDTSKAIIHKEVISTLLLRHTTLT